MEGSWRTMPWPRTNTSVFAVPRSIAKSLENFVAQLLDNTFSPGLDSIALGQRRRRLRHASFVWPCGILQVVVASRHFVPPTTQNRRQPTSSPPRESLSNSLRRRRGAVSLARGRALAPGLVRSPVRVRGLSTLACRPTLGPNPHATAA